MSTPHPTLCMWTPNTDLAPTGFGLVESLPWGLNIKTLGWLLPVVIRSKALPCSDVPMTGLQQQKATGEEGSSFHRLGRTRGSGAEARISCWVQEGLGAMLVSIPESTLTWGWPYRQSQRYHGSVHQDL